MRLGWVTWGNPNPKHDSFCVKVHLGPLVGFGGFNDNTIEVLTSMLSVEHEIEYIAYTCCG